MWAPALHRVSATASPLVERCESLFEPFARRLLYACPCGIAGNDAELLAMSGERNPYPGKLGVVEEGALADLILVDGNPLEKIELIANPAVNFVVIVKDGRIYKNLVQ